MKLQNLNEFSIRPRTRWRDCGSRLADDDLREETGARGAWGGSAEAAAPAAKLSGAGEDGWIDGLMDEWIFMTFKLICVLSVELIIS